MAESDALTNEVLSEELRALGWQLGNNGEPIDYNRVHPGLPLWTAHHPRFGITWSTSGTELLKFVHLVGEAAMSLAAMDLQLQRADVSRPFSGWYVRRSSDQALVMWTAHGTREDATRLLDWARGNSFRKVAHG